MSISFSYQSSILQYQQSLGQLLSLANATPPPRRKLVSEIIRDMGDKWCLHPANRVKRLPHEQAEFKGSRILTEWLRKREESHEHQ